MRAIIYSTVQSVHLVLYVFMLGVALTIKILCKVHRRDESPLSHRHANTIYVQILRHIANVLPDFRLALGVRLEIELIAYTDTHQTHTN